MLKLVKRYASRKMNKLNELTMDFENIRYEIKMFLCIMLIIVPLPTIYYFYRITLWAMMGKCNCKNFMYGKTVIITGANTGIGFETAISLAERGARVILACRNMQKAKAARDQIITISGNSNIEVKYLDLHSFNSVRIFVNDILRTESKLDVLINNAGTLNLSIMTQDLLPSEIQVNYFSPFLLTMLLLPLLKKSAPSRIINVSSNLYKQSKLLLTTLHAKTDPSYNRWNLFPNVKLATLLFTKRLSIELEGTGVTANAADPGVVYTDLFRNRGIIVKYMFKLLMKTPFEGAQTLIHLAVCPNLSSTTGKMFSECRKVRTTMTDINVELGNILWKLSEVVVFNEQDNLKIKKKKVRKIKRNISRRY